jgi:RNA recognition motif-containing protein
MGVYIVKDSEGKSKGTAFIKFAQIEDAEKALEEAYKFKPSALKKKVAEDIKKKLVEVDPS